MEVIADAVLTVSESSQAGEARRAARTLAERLEFDETDAGKAAILAAELATNLVKHTGGGGHLLVRGVERNDVAGVELLAFDQGPGIHDINASFRDGYSTAGSPGTGLGALTRLASEWDLHTLPDIGTAVLARLWSREPGPRQDVPVEVSGMRVPAPGETACGDTWSVRREERRLILMVADGLGHGSGAATASKAAADSFERTRTRPPVDMLDAMHHSLRTTRGAAAAIAELDYDSRKINFAGVGNISAFLLTSPTESRSFVSYPGTLGHQVRRMQEMKYDLPPTGLLVLHSDGVSARWALDRYPGLFTKDPALIAGVLWRDFGRGRDDATVVVARICEEVAEAE